MEPQQDASRDLDREWLLINTIRETFGIARRGTITYADAVTLAGDLAPALLREDSPFAEGFEAALVRLYRERAEARSRSAGRDISPVELLDSDIRDRERELGLLSPGEGREIESQLRALERARRRLDTSRWTESQVISRDADLGRRELPVSGRGQGYRAYRISEDRVLRIRVLHPDPLEHRSGTDLMYETYWDRERQDGSTELLVRFVALQYKMWDGKALYISEHTNLRGQMDRMHDLFCASGLCKPPSTPGADERYRLPYCCAFLRPTDRIQTRDAWRVSHAWHVPLCVVREDLEPTGRGHEVLYSKRIRCKSLTQGPFQELYNTSMLGSRWISSGQLSRLYDEIGLFNDLDRVVVHAQEYGSII